MFRMAYSEIVERIVSKTGLKPEDIDELVAAKMDQLSGLISREGAAHIIANEKGIKLFEDIAQAGDFKINKISIDKRSVNTVGKVTKVYEIRKFKSNEREGKVGAFFLGDETGKIRITLWNDQADKMRSLKEGDVVKIKNALVRENNGFTELHLNDKSDMTINPLGVKIDVKESRQPSIRKKISELREGDENIDLLGTVVQVFNPNFFEVCSKCGKRVKADSSFSCPEHGIATPVFSYVLNASLDDGTGVIRTAFYRNQVLKLFKSTNEDFMKVKENPELFEPMKDELIGNIIRVVGKTRKNSMSNDMEFTSQLVFPNPNPEEEISKII